jgi:hypothetical protein
MNDDKETILNLVERNPDYFFTLNQDDRYDVDVLSSLVKNREHYLVSLDEFQRDLIPDDYYFKILGDDLNLSRYYSILPERLKSNEITFKAFDRKINNILYAPKNCINEKMIKRFLKDDFSNLKQINENIIDNISYNYFLEILDRLKMEKNFYEDNEFMKKILTILINFDKEKMNQLLSIMLYQFPKEMFQQHFSIFL